MQVNNFLMLKKETKKKQATATKKQQQQRQILKPIWLSDRAVEVVVLAIVSLDAHTILC